MNEGFKIKGYFISGIESLSHQGLSPEIYTIFLSRQIEKNFITKTIYLDSESAVSLIEHIYSYILQFTCNDLYWILFKFCKQQLLHNPPYRNFNIQLSETVLLQLLLVWRSGKFFSIKKSLL